MAETHDSGYARLFKRHHGERTVSYQEFLKVRSQSEILHGFNDPIIPDGMFDFQEALLRWAVMKGRGAILADCGLGKTFMELAWADNVVRHTNKPVLLLTPLAVAGQTVRESDKFGIDSVRMDASPGRAVIVVSNYERLHHFDPNDFAGVVCDESSAIKSFNGVRRHQVTEFLRKMPYRLLATATAAPNDYIELGTSSEALGELGHMDMLARFFKNDQNSADVGRKHGKVAKWRFKGHAETPFWKFVCSWARACRKPSDLGFSDDRFVLPPLIENEHVVETTTPAPGMLFALPACGLEEEREERRRTLKERCEKAADLVRNTGKPAIIWCHMNAEGDLLEKLLPDFVQVSGADSDDQKEEAYESFVTGKVRGLITKPKIGAWGLNFQHCAHIVTFASHSYEQYYQSVRRCWRFGQTSPVVVDLVCTEGERGVRANMRRKAEAADRMFTELVAHMNDAMRIDRLNTLTKKAEIPSWL